MYCTFCAFMAKKSRPAAKVLYNYRVRISISVSISLSLFLTPRELGNSINLWNSIQKDTNPTCLLELLYRTNI